MPRLTYPMKDTGWCSRRGKTPGHSASNFLNDITTIVDVDDKDCPPVWVALKGAVFFVLHSSEMERLKLDEKEGAWELIKHCNAPTQEPFTIIVDVDEKNWFILSRFIAIHTQRNNKTKMMNMIRDERDHVPKYKSQISNLKFEI